jgi:folylpolyglutamate synthase/dihydropteroate synthase
VFGVLKDKNLDLILKPLKNIFESWHISNSNNERALSVHELKKNNFFILEKPNVYDTIEDAYNGAIEIADINKDVIIVFGSSYTIAPILKRREI